MKVTKRITGLFWTTTDASSAEEGEGSAPEVATPTALPAAPSNVVPFRAASPVAGQPAAIDAVFAAIYAKTPGDAKIDQLLVAFESMKVSMAAPQLAIALSATAVALGAEESTMVATIEARVRALDAVVADEQRKAVDRHAARSTELEATTAAVHAEIKTMESRVVALRQQLAAATESLQHKTAGERASLATFEQRARLEATRHGALREVLAPAARLARKH